MINRYLHIFKYQTKISLRYRRYRTCRTYRYRSCRIRRWCYIVILIMKRLRGISSWNCKSSRKHILGLVRWWVCWTSIASHKHALILIDLICSTKVNMSYLYWQMSLMFAAKWNYCWQKTIKGDLSCYSRSSSYALWRSILPGSSYVVYFYF